MKSCLLQTVWGFSSGHLQADLKTNNPVCFFAVYRRLFAMTSIRRLQWGFSFFRCRGICGAVHDREVSQPLALEERQLCVAERGERLVG